VSTEHEGGNVGSQQPVPADGAGPGPLPYAQERAVQADTADDTVVQPVAPPADPALAGFPPPTVQPPAAQPPATQPSATQPSATQPSATQPPATQPLYGQPSAGEPAAAQQPAGQPPLAQPSAGQPSFEQPSLGKSPQPQPPVGQPPTAAAPVDREQESAAPSAPAFPPAYPADAPTYPAQSPAYPQQPPVYGAQPTVQQQTMHQPPYDGGNAGQGGNAGGGHGDFGQGGSGGPGDGGAGDGSGAGLPPYSGYPGSAYPPPGSEGPYGPVPRKRRRGGLIAVLAATAIIAGAIGGGIGAALDGGDSSSGTTTVSSSVNPKDLSRAPDSIAGIAAKALPSVVTISASNSQESGTGTGFVYDTQGHILTNNHVVAPSTNGGKLSVKFSDGSSYPATIVGRASGYDVAVIKIDGTPKKPLVPLALGNSDQVAVGDTTIAIGAPFGLSGTVTSGIISAKNRPVASGDETGAQTSYMNALQTDASINPGNSGGPLMNSSGQVIGIDSAIQSTGQTDSGGQSGSIGLGFAIPINQAKWVADQLIKTGKPTYPIIGVLRDDSYTGDGAKIASAAVQGTPAITPGGPADKAGLKPGDIITQLDGVQIDSGPTLVSEIWSHHPGDVVTVTYTRAGKTYTTSLTLGSRVGDQ
jgi:putative serine protease PepD